MFEAAQSGDPQFEKKQGGRPAHSGPKRHPMRSNYHDQNWSSIHVSKTFLVAYSR